MSKYIQSPTNRSLTLNAIEQYLKDGINVLNISIANFVKACDISRLVNSEDFWHNHKQPMLRIEVNKKLKDSEWFINNYFSKGYNTASYNGYIEL